MAEGGGGHADGVKRREGLLLPGGKMQAGHPEKTGWTSLLAGGAVQIRTRQACPRWRSENCK